MFQQSTFDLFTQIKFRLVFCSACALVAMACSSIKTAHPTDDQTWTESATELATAQRELADEDRALIRRHYPELVPIDTK
ncbi:MAG: hypothetical protein NTU79_01385 [Planctomycetota bacterium]|nr:hypothetical protein [Planctomycetota bacterium]